MARISIRVIPNAARNEIIGWTDDVLKVKIKAVPEDGKANRELLRFLAKHLSIPARDISLVSGEKNRNKIIELPDHLTNQLQPPQPK